MRYYQGDSVNTSLSRRVYCTHVHCLLVSLVLVDCCSFPVCVWLSSVARSYATKDANNKDNVCKPNIPAGIKCPPPSKTIPPITWFANQHMMYGHSFSKNMDQPGKVVNPARGQLNRENEYFPVRVRAEEFGLARRVWQSRPASAYSSPYSG